MLSSSEARKKARRMSSNNYSERLSETKPVSEQSERASVIGEDNSSQIDSMEWSEAK